MAGTNYGSMDIVPVNGNGGSPKVPAKRTTARGLRKLAQKEMVEAAPDVLKKYWQAVKNGLDRGDKSALDIVSQAFGYTKAAGGLTVLQAMQVNNNNGKSEGAAGRSFDSIVRKLEAAAEDDGPLAQPDEDEDADIIDAETEDLEG